MPGTNALAYLASLSMTKKNSFINLLPQPNVKRFFIVVIMDVRNKPIAGKPFQHSLMFVSMATAYPSEASLSGSLEGMLLALSQK